MYFKEHRLKAGLSVPAMSRLTGLPVRTIEGLEKRRDCLVSNALKYCAALGITLNDLCSPPESD